MRSLRSVVSNPNSMHEPSSRLHWPKWPCDSFHLLSSRSRRLLYSTNIEDIHMRLYVGCAPLVTRASTRKKKKRSTLPIIAAFGSSTLAASEGGTTCDAQATSFNIRVEICSCRSDNLGVRIFFVVQKRIPFLSRSHSAPEQVTCARLSYAGQVTYHRSFPPASIVDTSFVHSTYKTRRAYIDIELTFSQ